MTEGKKVHMPYGAYHKTTIPGHDPELTHTDPGTPMGELMRKQWQPICMSEQLTDVPYALRIMGEDLVAFRDREGRVGVLQRIAVLRHRREHELPVLLQRGVGVPHRIAMLRHRREHHFSVLLQ